MSTSVIEANTLATRINEAHRLATAAAGVALEHAIEAGQLLIEAKSECRHGEWQQWLAEHFEGSLRTAQCYMQVARDYGSLPKAQRAALLPLRQAICLIARQQDLGALEDSAALARVSEADYANGRLVLNAVDEGMIEAAEVDVIRRGEKTIHEVSDELVERAANLVGVSTNAIRQAVAIKKADPELAQQVRDGKLTLDEASAEIAKRTKPRDEWGLKEWVPQVRKWIDQAYESWPKDSHVVLADLLDDLALRVREGAL